MAYTDLNYKSKAALKRALASGASVTCYQPGLGLGPPVGSVSYTGSVTLEGPHYPAAHTWYGQGQIVDGLLVSVK